jgi:periplasmic protein TonB
VQAIPGFSDTDRLGLTAFGSVLLHMVVILGVTFTAPRIHMPGLETMEITLVQIRTEQAPDQPQFLAQANQDGGGDSERHEIAGSPLPLLELGEHSRELPVAQPEPRPEIKSSREWLAQLARDEEERRRLRTIEPEPEHRPERSAEQAPGLPDRAEFTDERARLSAEISRSWQEYQKMPRRKFLNARTQEYKYAAYMDAWRAKVERIGNLNYPEKAKRQNIAGSLVLDVALNPDGSLHDITLRRPSGHPVLDDAAVRIVELAAPFAPLPPDIRAETDILHITRTWKFRDATLLSEVD